MALKPYCAGCIDFSKRSSYANVPGRSLNLRWADLQLTNGGPLQFNLIDSVLAALTGGQFLKLRLLCGNDSPAWAKTLGGVTPVTVTDPQGGISGTVGKYWQAGGPYQTAYQAVVNALGARYDANPRLRGMCAGMAGTMYAEQFQRGGGTGNPTWVNLTAAGITKALDLQAIIDGVGFLVAAFPNTPIEVALTPYQVGTLADTETTAGTMKTNWGAHVVFGNNGLRWPRLGGQTASLYGWMSGQPTPSQGQTATAARIGDTLKTLSDAASMGFCSCELPGGYEGLVTDAQLAGPNAALIGNLTGGSPAPTVSAVSPATGPPAGGTVVTITGTNFAAGAVVNFGATPGTNVAVLSPTSITVTAPAGVAGVIDVTVTTPAGGTSATSAADRFTYAGTGMPTVSALSVASGPIAGGTSITLTGTNFTGATSVQFGTVPGTGLVVNSPTSITIVSPAHATGSTHVTVTTPTGTSATSAADVFTYTSTATPAVTAISPSSGPPAGGTVATLTGTNFTGVTSVSFGGTAGTGLVVNSATSITITSPVHAAGAVDITVTSPGGTSAVSSADLFTYAAAGVPTVSSISPRSGPLAGGTSVAVVGTNFTGATAVKFGAANGTGLVVNSATSITIVAPSAATITDSFSRANSATTLTPATTGQSYTALNGSTWGISANLGYLVTSGGGDDLAVIETLQPDVTIDLVMSTRGIGNQGISFRAVDGSNYWTLSANGTYGNLILTKVVAGVATVVANLGLAAFDHIAVVALGNSIAVYSNGVLQGTYTDAFNQSATRHGIWQNGGTGTRFNSLSMTFPSVVDITVTTPSGTSTATANDVFSYTAAGVPTVTAVSPNTGSTAGGTRITITGTNFTSATAVTFAPLVAPVAGTGLVVNSATSITVTAPPLPVGNWHVTVTTPVGTSATSPLDLFAAVSSATPTVSAISPTAGPAAGGTPVTITGSGFTAGATVSFGGAAATAVTVVSPTSITCTAPAHSAGVVDVTVSTNVGISPVSGADQFTFSASFPSVSGVSPSTGPIGGGTLVTITGANFTGATAVNFGATPGTSLTVVSPNTITIIAPAHAAAAVDVTVVTPSGTSATSPADLFTFTSASLDHITVPAPAGLQPGDFVEIFAAWIGAAITMTTPVGLSTPGPVASAVHVQQYFYGFAAGTETGWLLQASAATQIAAIRVTRSGVKVAAPFEGGTPATSGQVNASSTVVDAGSALTIVHPGALLEFFGAIVGTPPPAITEPAGFTAEGQQAYTTKAAVTNISVFFADEVGELAGAVGAVQGAAASAAVNGAMAVALTPA